MSELDVKAEALRGELRSWLAANYTPEVEAAIDSFPGVRSSAVIGLPDEDMGNLIHAIVDAPVLSQMPHASLNRVFGGG